MDLDITVILAPEAGRGGGGGGGGAVTSLFLINVFVSDDTCPRRTFYLYKMKEKYLNL